MRASSTQAFGPPINRGVQSAYGTGSASDAVRAYCEARLRSAVANGTITWEDFERRLDATYSVDTLAELDELVRSLPDLPDIPAKAISPRRKNGVGAAVIAATLCGAMLLVFLVVHSSPKSPSVSVPTTASEARSARRGPTRRRPPTVPTSAAKGAGLPGARAKATGWRVGWAYQALPKGFTVISGGSSDNPISCTPGTTFCVAVVSAPTATMNGFVPLGDVVTTDGRTWTGYRGIPSVFAVVNGILLPHDFDLHDRGRRAAVGRPGDSGVGRRGEVLGALGPTPTVQRLAVQFRRLCLSFHLLGSRRQLRQPGDPTGHGVDRRGPAMGGLLQPSGLGASRPGRHLVRLDDHLCRRGHHDRRRSRAGCSRSAPYRRRWTALERSHFDGPSEQQWSQWRVMP